MSSTSSASRSATATSESTQQLRINALSRKPQRHSNSPFRKERLNNIYGTVTATTTFEFTRRKNVGVYGTITMRKKAHTRPQTHEIKLPTAQPSLLPTQIVHPFPTYELLAKNASVVPTPSEVLSEVVKTNATEDECMDTDDVSVEPFISVPVPPPSEQPPSPTPAPLNLSTLKEKYQLKRCSIVLTRFEPKNNSSRYFVRSRDSSGRYRHRVTADIFDETSCTSDINSCLTDDDDDLQKAIKISRGEFDKENQMEAESALLPNPLSGIPLSELMVREVEKHFALPEETKVITKFTLTIKQLHLIRYKKGEWLEDPNIDFYLEMIRERNEVIRHNGINYPRIYVFHSFFYKFCSKNDFDVVKDTTTDNIFLYDLAFFPILIRDHWRLIVADFKEKTILCYDSMYRVNDQSLTTIERYLEREYKSKVESQNYISSLELPDTTAAMSPESEAMGSDVSNTDTIPIPSPNTLSSDDENESFGMSPKKVNLSTQAQLIPSWGTYIKGWKKETLDPTETGLPQQNNGSDCGIFLCQYAESLARGVRPPFDFTQRNMLYFRYLMAFETINGCISERRNPLTMETTPAHTLS